jgi:hypothetical protein
MPAAINHAAPLVHQLASFALGWDSPLSHKKSLPNITWEGFPLVLLFSPLSVPLADSRYLRLASIPFSQRLSSGAALINAAPLLQAPASLALPSGLRQKEPCQRLSTIAAPLVYQLASFALGSDSPLSHKKSLPNISREGLPLVLPFRH